MNIITRLQNNGFKVVGRYIQKRDTKTNNFEVKGYLNDNSIYFFSDNVYPFKSGNNYFSEYTEKDTLAIKQYVAKEREQEAKNPFKVSFDTYKAITSSNSTFQTFLNKTTRKHLNRNYYNYYDLSGVSSGYMEGAVCFPFIDYEGNFITAQLIKYDDKGKRLKSDFSTNWFHSYKPFKEQIEGVNREEKYKVEINCFFGENYLKESDNVVAIVEAPKTASILKEIYPDIDFIATAGEKNLYNKDFTVLQDKKIVVFPDAKTKDWKEFANKKGWFCSDILEVKSVEDGDDLADYIFKNEHEVFTKLHDLLTVLSEEGSYNNLDHGFNFLNVTDKLDFEFKVIGEQTNYYIAVPSYFKGNTVNLSVDGCTVENAIYKGNYFTLYSEKYQYLNAQIDWHRPHNFQNTFTQLTEEQFIYNLQKCYTLLKAFNPEIYKGVFAETLKNLVGCNYHFNKYYVLNKLVPLWDRMNKNVDEFIKERDWKFNGGKSLSRKQFIQELNNTRFIYKLQIALKGLDEAIAESRFIDVATDLGIGVNGAQRGYSQIIEKIKEYNQKYIGAKTFKTYLKKVEFDSVLKNSPVYIENLIYSGEKRSTVSISVRKAKEITGNKNTNQVSNFLKFAPDESVKESLMDYVFYLLENLNTLEVERFSDRIVGFTSSDDYKKKVDVFNNLENLDVFKSLDDLKAIDLDGKENKGLDYEIKYLSFLKALKDNSVEANDSVKRMRYIKEFFIDVSPEPVYNNLLKVA